MLFDNEYNQQESAEIVDHTHTSFPCHVSHKKDFPVQKSTLTWSNPYRQIGQLHGYFKGIQTEPQRLNSCFLNMRKHRRRSVIAQLISAFVFATYIVQSILFLNPKFQVCTSHRLLLCSPVCVGPDRNPEVRFTRDAVRQIPNKAGYLCLVVRKPAFCICENKDADQLRGNREADQRLCFRYTDSTIPLLPKSEISNL